MLRSGLSRSVSILLLLSAGSFEPVWQLGHAVLHLEASHHAPGVQAHIRHTGDPDSRAVLAADHETGHEHPVFQAPVRPRADLTPPTIALPAVGLVLAPAPVAVTREVFLAAPARASPLFDYTAPTRAPPLT